VELSEHADGGDGDGWRLDDLGMEMELELKRGPAYCSQHICTFRERTLTLLSQIALRRVSHNRSVTQKEISSNLNPKEIWLKSI